MSDSDLEMNVDTFTEKILAPTVKRLVAELVGDDVQKRREAVRALDILGMPVERFGLNRKTLEAD